MSVIRNLWINEERTANTDVLNSVSFKTAIKFHTIKRTDPIFEHNTLSRKHTFGFLAVKIFQTTAGLAWLLSKSYSSTDGITSQG